MRSHVLVRICGVGLAGWSVFFLFVAYGILCTYGHGYDPPGNWVYHLGLTDLRIVGEATSAGFVLALAMALAHVTGGILLTVACLAYPTAVITAGRITRLHIRSGVRQVRRFLPALSR